MRSYGIVSLVLAVLSTGASAIQVECRQAYLVRRNDEYFDRAKKAVNKGSDDIKAVEPVSNSYLGIDRDEEMEYAATNAAFVPRQVNSNVYSSPYSAQQIALQEGMSRYYSGDGMDIY